ncbi:MAG TPA: VCBS repeat-containing protein, partial [Blastocatellia bacterium]
MKKNLARRILLLLTCLITLQTGYSQKADSSGAEGLAQAFGRQESRAREGTQGRGRPFFLDVLKESGIVFKNAAPMLDRKISHVNPLLANYVSSAAVGDFNNDGYDDIFFVSNYKGQLNALYKNKGNLKFEDVTKRSGIADFNDEDNFCSGALWFDYDNDGLTDLFIARFGYSLLFKNNGNGTFRNVTVKAKIGTRRQNTLAVIAFDYNNDGYLDLLTGGFFADDVNLLNLKSTKFLPTSDQRSFNGGSKILYKNNGDGTFSDVTTQAGINDTGFTAALGEADYDNDGWQDFYVANDFGPDKLYHNDGNGAFTDVSRNTIGVDGRKGMNVDWGDYNNDGFLDIYITNMTEPWQRECNMLWV